MRPVVFRAGVIYGKEVKLLEAARWLMRRNLFAIWHRPTWLHLLSLPDFLRIVEIGIERNNLSGIYNLCDDEPMLLQDFLDALANHWGYKTPWRIPAWTFYLAAIVSETFSRIFITSTPLTRDIVTMGMTSVVADNSRMKKELVQQLLYPSFREGIILLE
jgi:NAD dependent epimerase/dehydratase family enzyme